MMEPLDWLAIGIFIGWVSGIWSASRQDDKDWFPYAIPPAIAGLLVLLG